MKRFIFLAALVVAAISVVAGSAMAASPSSKSINLLKNVAYYTVNNNQSTFCRWAKPQASVALTPTGTASQKAGGSVSLSITGATGYADNGFYEPLGTLGSLTGYTVAGSGSQFSTNLWFDTSTSNDTSTNGDFFSWSGGCLSGSGGDTSGLGPSSVATANGGQSVTVTSASTFNLTCSGTYGPVSLAQLSAGYCSGIDATTPVAVWVGITAASGGSLSTKITSFATS